MDDPFSTRTKVLKKSQSLVPLERIRPTDPPHPEAADRMVRYSPIVMVLADDGFCYIVDGNHRYYRKLRSGVPIRMIQGWVLDEGDAQKLRGDPLPQPLQDWRDGLITYGQLCAQAQRAWQSAMSRQLLEIPVPFLQQGSSAGKVHASGDAGMDEKHDPRALERARTILQILAGKLTLDRAARLHDVSEQEIVAWQKSFIDGGIRALKARLDGGE